MSEMDRPPFYVGYLGTPKPLVGFLAATVGAVLGISVVLAVSMVVSQDDWGDAAFQWGDGYQTRTGILRVDPYPVVYLPPDADFPEGRAIPLSGEGKTGVREKAAALDGRPVEVGGFLLRAGSREMIQVGGEVDLRVAGEASALAGFTGPVAVPLGARTLRGEIVDSKCYLGAMRPGQGKTHKLCANLCLIGGIPPMFVVYRADGPPDVLLLAERNGGPVTEALLGDTARYVELSGTVERRADLLVFRVDPSTLRRL
ncbi:MAG: hypothetical protein GC206_07180 [Alphaproteobacteria bacterium]|nr:hypothetical protein [Alphaproteobacteria bacterium]